LYCISWFLGCDNKKKYAKRKEKVDNFHVTFKRNELSSFLLVQQKSNFTVFRFVEEKVYAKQAHPNSLRAKDLDLFAFCVQLCEVGPFSDYASYTAHQIQGFLSMKTDF